MDCHDLFQGCGHAESIYLLTKEVDGQIAQEGLHRLEGEVDLLKEVKNCLEVLKVLSEGPRENDNIVTESLGKGE